MAGNEFRRIDFHTHTPASTDYRGATTSYKDIVDAAVGKSLDAIVVSDHNTIDGISQIRLAAQGTELVIFPGIELSSPYGHFLAVFDPMSDIELLDEVLTLSGIPKAERGRETALTKDLHEVMEMVSKKGGIVIAAHADGPKGFLESEIGQQKIRIYNDPNLHAIEIVNPDLYEEFTSGSRSGYTREMPCLMGSDAHDADQIGQRYSVLKMSEVNLIGLRHAFTEHKLRIKAADKFAETNYPRILSLTVDKGFLAGQKVEFNSQLTCLVGGAGSGKSTIIEFLRFGLGQISDIQQIASDSSGKLKDLATIGAIVSIELELLSGEKLTIERTFTETDNPVVIHRANGTVSPDVDISALFPIHAYSQGEAISISRNKLAQLGLIDQHIEVRSFQQRKDAIYSELDSQVEGLGRLVAKIADRENLHRQLATVEEKIAQESAQISRFEEAKSNQHVKEHEQWLVEKNYLALIYKALNEKIDLREIEEKLGDIDFSITRAPLPKEATPNQNLLEEINKLAIQLHEVRNQARKLMLDELERIERDITQRGQDWRVRFEAHENAYKAAGVNSDQVGAAHARLEQFMKEKSELEARLNQIDLASQALDKQLTRRRALLDELKQCRANIFERRDKKAKQLGKKLEGALSLGVIENGNTETYKEKLVQLFKGSNIRHEDLRAIADVVDPLNLGDLLIRRDYLSLSNLVSNNLGFAKRVTEWCSTRPEIAYGIETSLLEDRVDIYYKISDGEYRLLDKLSTGQKATGIVLLSMVEGNCPVIFDQPEDALYTPNIYSYIVSALRQEKDQRQFILATHNANIVLGGDVDQGIVLEAGAGSTKVKTSGGIDNPATHSAMLLHLEGGKEAFEVRKEKWKIGS